GNILRIECVADQDSLGIRFDLTAAGMRSQAQTSFVDGNPVASITSISPNPAASVPTVNATITENGNSRTNISAAEYFIDSTGSDGAGTAMTATGTAFGTIQTQNVTVTLSATPLNALAHGTHTIFVHGKDQTIWGNSASATF